MRVRSTGGVLFPIPDGSPRGPYGRNPISRTPDNSPRARPHTTPRSPARQNPTATRPGRTFGVLRPAHPSFQSIYIASTMRIYERRCAGSMVAQSCFAGARSGACDASGHQLPHTNTHGTIFSRYIVTILYVRKYVVFGTSNYIFIPFLQDVQYFSFRRVTVLESRDAYYNRWSRLEMWVFMTL